MKIPASHHPPFIKGFDQTGSSHDAFGSTVFSDLPAMLALRTSRAFYFKFEVFSFQ